MDSEKEQQEKRRRSELTFFGRIMANVSHEFNNVITVIGELSGLLHDLSLLAERGKPIQVDKLQKITENIARQVARAKELISNMNKFAHSVDEPLFEFDLRDIVGNMQVLTRRMIEYRQASFSYTQPVKDVRITSDPFSARHALFTCLELAMSASSSPSSLSLEIDSNQTNTAIRISSNMDEIQLEGKEAWHELEMIVCNLGGALALIQNDPGITLKMDIPTHLEKI